MPYYVYYKGEGMLGGGPLNGVSWAATAATAGGIPGVSALHGGDTNDSVNYTGIIIPTTLQMAADSLSYCTSMTCLYDPDWTAEEEKVTLPL